MRKFWIFNSLSPTSGELLLYGDIRSEKPWWDEGGNGIYPRQFAEDLKALGNISELTVRINSRGGDVSAATAIYTQLKNHPATVTAIIDGMAASAATIIMMAADVIKAPAPAQVMVHDPMLVLIGMFNGADLDRLKGIWEVTKNSIINAYVNKTGRNRDEISEMMRSEKWMTAEEAKVEGFVDEILFEETVEASITNDNRFMVVNSVAHDLSIFNSRPKLHQTPSIPFIPLTQSQTPNKGRENTVEIKNVEDLKKHYPDLCNQLVEEAKATAAATERERIKAIDEISATVAADLVNKAKYEEPMSAEKLALLALKADAAKGAQHLNDRAAELQNNAGVTSEAGDADAQKKKEAEAAAIDLIAAAANKFGKRMEAR
ncbi:head maturation protease, ClpP-related [Paenibacillus cisolokensis]|uniref:head maturation protease, ClpP-related n=1 Tax=Paenibacillus cisolokensis TaxID=1658519 RepID=UPI003D2E0508